MLERPTCGDMPHHEHTSLCPTQRQIIEKTTDAMDGLPPTFAMRIGFIQVVPAMEMQLSRRHAILIPIVTFSQAPVLKDRDWCIPQRDFDGLHSSLKIRGEDRVDAIVAAAVA